VGELTCREGCDMYCLMSDAAQHCFRYLCLCNHSVVTSCFRGEKFLLLPYVVKGMDVSFSGILSHLEEQVGSTFVQQGVCLFILILVGYSACV